MSFVLTRQDGQDEKDCVHRCECVCRGGRDVKQGML